MVLDESFLKKSRILCYGIWKKEVMVKSCYWIWLSKNILESSILLS